MTFRVFVKTGELYYTNSDGEREWDGDEGEWVEVEATESNVLDAITDILFDEYFASHIVDAREISKVKASIWNMADDMRLPDNDDFIETWEDRIKEWLANNVTVDIR